MLPADPIETLAPLIRSFGVREAARRTGISQPSISQWMAGKKAAIGAENLERLAQLFGYTTVSGLVKIPKKSGN